MSRKYVSRDDSEEDTLAATIYAEARGEGWEGMQAVGHVIKNRANANRTYMGGSNVKDVCLKESQFECWNGNSSIYVGGEEDSYRNCQKVARDVLSGRSQDPTGGCLYYNNPDKETADWTQRVREVKRINSHVFYEDL